MNNKFTYTVAETSANYATIQNQVKKGLIPQTKNKNSSDVSYFLNEKILESLLLEVDGETYIEFDEELKIYTAFHSIIPQICAESDSIDNLQEAYLHSMKDYVLDYINEIDLFSVFLNGLQQFILGLLILNIDDDQKCLEILNFG